MKAEQFIEERFSQIPQELDDIIKLMEDYTELILKENNIHISKFLTKLSKDYENGEIEDIEDVIYEAENLKTKIDYQNYYKKL